MSYSIQKLTTVAECDQANQMATERKNDYLFDQTVTERAVGGQEKSTALTNAGLLSTIAEITGTEAAIAAMPDGEAKSDLQNKLRRLNDRKDNLNERLQKGGSPALLDTELDAGLIKAQLAEIDVFLAAVLTRKSEL
jgi:hypothetical protein